MIRTALKALPKTTTHETGTTETLKKNLKSYHRPHSQKQSHMASSEIRNLIVK